MRLVSCKIENFGMLHGVQHTFDASIHTIMAENGTGKSTLAAFLKAMLYGLEGKGRSIEDNERKRYLPWQGGRFGGTLVFSANGHLYRAERFFGLTPKGDTFALYDAKTNLPSSAFSSSLGEELFGIDGEAFSHTTFFTWRAMEKTEANNSIHAKLNGLYNVSDDIGDFDAAIARLDAQRRIYEKRGNTGKLADLEEELSLLSGKLEHAALAEAAVIRKTTEYVAKTREKDAAEAEYEALRAEVKARQRTEKQRGVARQLSRYDKEITTCDLAMEAACATASGADALEDVFESALQNAKDAYSDHMLALSRAQDCQKEIAASKEMLDKGTLLPDETTFAVISDAVMQYTALSSTEMSADAPLSETECRRASELLYKAEAAYDAQQRAGEAYQRTVQAVGDTERDPIGEDELTALRMRIQCLRAQQTEKGGTASAHRGGIAVLGFALLCIGVLGIVLLHTVPLAIAAFACLIVAGGVLSVLGLRARSTRGKGHDITSEKAELDAVFATYGMAASEETGIGYEVLLARLTERNDNIRAYRICKTELQEKEQLCLSSIQALQSAVCALTDQMPLDESSSAAAHLAWARTEIARAEATSAQAKAQRKQYVKAKEAAEAALAPYPSAVGENPTARLSALREAVSQQREHKKQLAILIRRVDAYIKEAAEAKEKIEAFLSRFGCRRMKDMLASLQAAEAARRDWKEAYAKKGVLMSERTQYLLGEGITEAEIPTLLALLDMPMPEDLTTDEKEAALYEGLDRYKADLFGLQTEIENLRVIADEIPYLRARQAAVQEEWTAATRMRDMIALTRGFLEGAKTELSTRYLRAMETYFHKYFRLVAPTREEEIAIDANLTPSVEVCGTRYPIEAFSHGLRDLLGLCMRISLTESMYEDSEERPPLILDDPFVNLDENKLVRARELLGVLAKRYQILYFTCHDSRSIS